MKKIPSKPVIRHFSELNLESMFWKEGVSDEEQVTLLDCFPYVSIPVPVLFEKNLSEIIVTGQKINIPGLEERKQCYTTEALLETKKRFENSEFIKRIDAKIKGFQEKLLEETIKEVRLTKSIIPFLRKRMQACEHSSTDFDQCISEYRKARETFSRAKATADYSAVEILKLKQHIEALENGKTRALAHVRKHGFQNSRLN